MDNSNNINISIFAPSFPCKLNNRLVIKTWINSGVLGSMKDIYFVPFHIDRWSNGALPFVRRCPGKKLVNIRQLRRGYAIQGSSKASLSTTVRHWHFDFINWLKLLFYIISLCVLFKIPPAKMPTPPTSAEKATWNWVAMAPPAERPDTVKEPPSIS